MSLLAGLSQQGDSIADHNADADAHRVVADFLVDSVLGDDSNDGRSDEYGIRPFKTIARLLQETLTSGMKVALARGSVWRETLTITSGVRVFAYGFGARPLLDASDPIAAASWAKTAGRTSVYEVTVPIEYVAGKTTPNVWVDGVVVPLADSLANCDSTAGTCWNSVSGSTFTIYVHTSSGASPAASGLWEYSRRSFGLDSYEAVGASITGLATRRNAHNDGSLIVGRQCTATDCTASDGNVHNVLARGGAALFNVVADQSYLKGSGPILFVYHETVAGTYSNIFTRCSARVSESVASATGFYGHGDSGVIFNPTYQNCTTVNCTLGGGPQDGAVAINGCNIAIGVSYGPGCATSVSADSLTTPSLIMLNNAPLILSNSNITADKTGNTNGIELSLSGATASILDTRISGRRPIYFYDVPQTVSVQRCDLSEAGWFSYKFARRAAVSLTSDFNVFPSPLLANVADYEGQTLSLAQWQAASGQDTHSTTAV